MLGVERSHCDAAMKAVLSGYYSFMEAPVEEALRQVLTYGKSDTLGLDAIPEINILAHLRQYDRQSVVITEETGDGSFAHLTDLDPRRFRTVFICDPTDRSAQIKAHLEGVEDKRQTVGEIVRREDMPKLWEQKFGGPASVTGGASAVTCIRRGVPIFTVMVNYVTQQLYLSCSAGNYWFNLPEDRKEGLAINTGSVTSNGEKLYFRDLNTVDVRRFVTFMGKSGYKENFLDSRLMIESDMERCLHYSLPGGPLRVLYLSNLQPSSDQVGFILSNGEKIGEWVHWLPFIRFARKRDDEGEPALRLYEVFQDRPWTRDGVLMSTPPSYSIFKDMEGGLGKKVVDVGRFSYFSNPSRIRSTLIVTPYDNDWAMRVVQQHGYRHIEMYSE